MQASLAKKFAERLNPQFGGSLAGLASFFPKTIAEIDTLTAEAKSICEQGLEAVLSDSTPSTINDVAIPSDTLRTELSVATGALSLAKSVCVDKEVRDAAAAALQKLQAYSIEAFSSNEKLYRKLKAVASSTEEPKSEKQQFFLTETIDEFERSGMKLLDDKAKFDKATELKKRIADLCVDFSKRIDEYQWTREFTADELKGTPEAALKPLKKSEDGTKYIVDLSYPIYFAITKHCDVAETRAIIVRAFEQRAPDNLPVLREILLARHELAQLLGYRDYAATDLASKMAKTPKTAHDFVDSLVPRLSKKWNTELKTLVAEIPDCEKQYLQGDSKQILASDLPYLLEKFKKLKLSVDEPALQKYFPTEHVLQKMLQLYSAFFGVSFKRHKIGTDIPAGTFWFDVEVLEITRMDGVLLGFIVMDLFPRTGKYSHACCYSSVPAIPLDAAGSAHSPAVAVLLCNFDKECLPHSDVVTLLHEAGHGLHSILSRVEFPGSFAGTRVKRDFVELPSQLLENFCWSDHLFELSSHIATGEKLPKQLFDAKLHAKRAFSGRDLLRQMCFAQMSLDLHSKEFIEGKLLADKDGTELPKLFSEITSKFLPEIKLLESTFPSSFGHLTGYAASYYGYALSEVFSLDCWKKINDDAAATNLATAGRRYAETILVPGGSVDPDQLLAKYLGRAPNADAFFADLGVQ